MASLKSLFDFQKIDGNQELDALIRDTERRYGMGSELSEDDLDMVAGGKLMSKVPVNTSTKKNKNRGIWSQT